MELNEHFGDAFGNVVPEPGVATIIAGRNIEVGDVTTDFVIFRSAIGEYETNPMVAETVEHENIPDLGGNVTTVNWVPVSHEGNTLKSIQSFYDPGEPVTIVRGEKTS